MTGEYIQWNRPDGQPSRGMRYVLKKGEEIRINEELVIAAVKFSDSSLQDNYYPPEGQCPGGAAS